MGGVIWKFTEEIERIDEKIKQVAELFQISFPNDFIETVSANNGGFPKPNCFEVIDGNEEVFNNLITFDLSSKYSILNIYDGIKDRLMDKVFPFARDPFGNYLCFDYRNGANPVIVFWEHETALIDKNAAIKKVFDTFTELLDNLYEYEDEEEEQINEFQ